MRKSLVLLGSLFLAVSAFATDVEHSFQSVVARSGIQRVVIDVPTGSFTIRNGAAGRLALSGIASRDYDSQKEKLWAQKVVDDTSVEFYVNGPEAIVRRKFGRNASSWRAQKFTGLDLRIELPPGVDVSFETTAGEVLAGDFGDVDIDMTAGEIDVKVPRAKVREVKASALVGEVRTNLGNKEVVTREGVLPGRTKYFNPAGKSHVFVHVTAGEVEVTLTP